MKRIFAIDQQTAEGESAELAILNRWHIKCRPTGGASLRRGDGFRHIKCPALRVVPYLGVVNGAVHYGVCSNSNFGRISL